MSVTPRPIKAKVKPSNSTQSVKWSSSNKKVATVNSKGKVTARKAGTATITAKSGKKSAKVKVKVVNPNAPVKVTKVTLDRSGTVKLPLNEKLTLTATLKPSGATGKLTWKSSNKKVATVKNGVVTPKKKGTATITVTCGKKSAKVKVKVVKASSTPAPTPKPDEPTTAPHTHTWEDVTTTVTHDEEGHWEIQNTKVQTGTKTTTVNHPAEGHWETVTSEQMVKEAWDEDVVIVDKAEWSEMVTTTICNACGQVITDRSQLMFGQSNIHLDCPRDVIRRFDMPDTPENRAVYDWPEDKHMTNGALYYSHIINTWVAEDGTPMMTVETRGGDYGSLSMVHETVTHPAETHTETVHHDAEYKTITDKVWVEDKAAWTEEVETPQYGYKTEQVWVVDKAAWTESVVTGKKCSECGATK